MRVLVLLLVIVLVILGPLHCLIRGMGNVWVECLDTPRLAAASELAASMGFPILPHWGDTGCLWTRGSPAPASRSRCNLLRQVGNSMHVNSVGAILMTVTALHFSKMIGAWQPIGRQMGQAAQARDRDSSEIRRPPGALTTAGATRLLKRKLSEKSLWS